MTRFNTLLLLLFGALPFFGLSQTTWTGNASVDWFDTNNWTNGLPGPGKDATIPAAPTGGRMPEIHAPLEVNFKVTNFGNVLMAAPVRNALEFQNRPGAFVRNRSEFSNDGVFKNDAVFQNGCPTCDPTNIGLTNEDGGSFFNHSTIVNDAKMVLSPCSVTFFDSPTKANLGGDIRLYGVAYVLQGDVQFAEQVGTVLFSIDDQPAPSISVKDVTVTLDANGSATVAPTLVDDGSTADYCSVATLSLSQAAFDCSNIGANVVTFTATDSRGNSATATATITVNPSAACYCSHLSDGGLIGGANYFCPGNSPAPLYNEVEASGAPSQYGVQYTWEYTYSDPANGVSGLNEVANSNNRDYTITALNQTAWFRRKARVEGCSVYSAYSDWQQVVWQTPFPTAVCQSIIVVKPNSGPAIVTPEQIDNGSVAGCIGIGSYSLSQTSFNAVGIYPVTLLVASTNGDVSACATTVEVRNPPTTSNLVPNCQTAEVVVTAPNYNSTGAVATFGFPAASTNCTLGSASTQQIEGLPSGSTFPIGETRITYRVTDPCNSSATCSFNVRVVKPAAPTYCASAINGAGTIWLQSVTINGQGQYVYTFKAENRAKWGLSHIAFEIPCNGTKAVGIGSTYTGASGRGYSVENTTKNPFYCIKFNNSGQEGIKNGQQETFIYTLPSTCPVPGSFKVLMKYATTSLTFTINPMPCVNSGAGNLQAPAYALRLDAQRKDFDVQVKWQAKIGKSVTSYDVERSIDGENWETIHTENGGGADGEITYMSYLDTKPQSGANFYRINAHLNIGIDWWTDAAKVEMPLLGDFNVFPNPAGEQAYLDLKDFKGRKVTINLSDNLGKVVRSFDVEEATEEPVAMDVKDLHNGYYSIQIVCGGLKQDKKLVVSHTE